MNLEAALQQRAQIQAFQRKHRVSLLTLLFTDIVGSTGLKQELGDREAVRLIQEHHAAVREILGRFAEGEEINTAGDSFFVVFAKPSDAVRFSLILQARFRGQATAGGKASQIQDRIGIHVGEVTIAERGDTARTKDLYGIQVDTCARVASLAEGDQILLSRSAFDSARQVLKGEDIPGVESLTWLNHGPYLMKGVEEPLEICEVGETDKARLQCPQDSEKVHRHISPDMEPVLGWRPALGQTVPNTKWVLEKKLGEGGFGEVWLGRHETLKQHRVFKFCFRADRVRPLKREVTLFRLLKERIGDHPNIVAVLDVFFDEPPYYLMMDHAEGQDLGAWCAAQGGADKIPMAIRLEIVAQVGDALQAAHDAGVIHRDVKPSNILICGTDSGADRVLVKLTDFGIGQVMSPEALAGMTRLGFTQTMMSSGTTSQGGTQMYMAPELMAGRPASVRSDIYSLGVVLYQLLAGDLTQPVTMDWAKEITDPFLREDLARCFAGNPQERFAGAAQLADHVRTLDRRRQAVLDQKTAYRRGVLRTAAVAVLLLSLVPGSLILFHRWRDRSSGDQSIQKLGAVYQGLKSYQDTATFRMDLDQAGVTQTVDGTATFAFVRPDKIHVSVKAGSGEARLVGDGSNAWTFASVLSQQFTVQESTNHNIRSVLEPFFGVITSPMLFGSIVSGVASAYAWITASDPHQSMMTNTTDLRFISAEKINGERALLFAWKEGSGGSELKAKTWIRANDGVVLKTEFDLSLAIGRFAMAQTGKSNVGRLVITTTHTNIRMNSEPDPGLFVFAPPRKARQVNSLDYKALLQNDGNWYPSLSRAELSQRIAGRDPGCPPQLIDLSDYYNLPLDATSHPSSASNDLASLPRGRQTLAGVEFDVRGSIHLTSHGTSQDGCAYPESVGIEVGRKTPRLHFLHSSILGLETTNGASIGAYVMHFANGERNEFPIVYGRDVVDWWDWKTNLPTQSQLAWMGTNQASLAAGRSLRVFKSTWENPFPGQPVERVEFRSSMMPGAASPFLVALTADSFGTEVESPASHATVTIALAAQRWFPIGLDRHHNARLNEVWEGEFEGNHMGALPRGFQTFTNVAFDVRGIIQLASARLRQGRSATFPDRVEGILVETNCQRLHFLHATAKGSAATETRVGHYVVHYKDGTKQEIPLLYGRDVQDWWAFATPPPTNAAVAWVGSNPASTRLRSTTRLYVFSWSNPRPEALIRSIDFVSALAEPAPFVVAITAELRESASQGPARLKESSLATSRGRPAQSLIRLPAYFNASLTSEWSGTARGGGGANNLASLPRGRQKLADTDFDIGGIVQLSSKAFRFAGAQYPERLEGIPVDVFCTHLHFLQASSFGRDEVGTQVGAYVLHTMDGKTHDVPIVYGKDVQDWWDWDPKPPQGSQIAWKGQNAASRQQRRSIRLFKTTWTNPVPNLKITSIDYVSAMANAAPFLVAITADVIPPIETASAMPAPIVAGDAVPEATAPGTARVPGAIDLSAHFNASLPALLSQATGSSVEPPSIPRVLKTKDGLEFVLDGAVQLGSVATKNAGLTLPEQITNVRVGRVCRRLHFLHATGPGGQVADGTEIGVYRVKYRDRQPKEIPIVYGQDLRSWWLFANETPVRRGAEVWSREVNGRTFRFFQRTWENPDPESPIDSLEIISTHSPASLLLIAITTEP